MADEADESRAVRPHMSRERYDDLVEERECLSDIIAEREGDLADLLSAKRKRPNEIAEARDALSEAERNLEVFDQGNDGLELKLLREEQGITENAEDQEELGAPAP